jgi:CMP-N,N'-diacetyllegionaminic acid synthase
MSEPLRRLCTICARGGSKGIKDKNLRLLAGKPLLAYSIEHARDSGLFDVLAVSSDSPAILEIADRWKVDYLIQRPLELAIDQAAKLPAIKHCVTEVQMRCGNAFDTLVDLDVTSPLRIPNDIREAVALLERMGTGNVITAMPARRSPYFNLIEIDSAGLVGLSKRPQLTIVRRQDAPRCYDMNASIYVWTQQSLFASDGVIGNETRLYVMPEERSIDIDSELDFQFVEFLLSRGAGADR